MQARWATPYLLLLPGALVIATFVAALAITGVLSFHDRQGALTFQHYQRFISDSFYLGYLWRSLKIALYCAPITLLLGYPFAFVMSRSSSGVRLALTIVLVVQFFTSDVVRVYALILVFGNNGIINRFLLETGLIDAPIRLLFREAGVAIGLILIPLPLMIFPIYSVLKNIESNLEVAATSLGANPIKTFFYITLPLSLPGVLAGLVLVFLFDLTAYVIPGMLGGGYFNMIANGIQDQALAVLDKPFAAAMAMTLLLVTLAILYLVHWIGSRMRGAT